jgi:hypothetical protein
VLSPESAARLQSLETAFSARFGHPAEPMAAMSYDAAALLIQVFQENQPPELRFFPPGFSSPGASGTLSFDTEGNRKVQLELLAVRQGHFVALAEAAVK